MSKTICEICGTTYPSSAESCPICGCSSAAAEELLGAENQDFFMDESETKASLASGHNRKKEIFDFDEVNSENLQEDAEEPEDEYEEEEEEEEEVGRHNTFVVIILTVLIVVLLCVAAFLFIRFFLPNKNNEEQVPAATVMHETQIPSETTEPVVPCEQMAMTNAGVAELNAEGQQFLLHIKVLPENTTDRIIYTSADESIATVTEDGKITAIAEGETTIYISCGTHSIPCPVIVKYVEETVPPTTEATVEETVSETAGATTGESAGENPAETTAETTSDDASQNAEGSGESTATTAPLKSNITLKLKKTDIRLGVYYGYQLELDCDLLPTEVTWSSEHPHIAKVDEEGNVTAMKEGTTSITAKYGDQEVQCIVRCFWL